MLFYSTLASKREMTNQDAMDYCITRAFLPVRQGEGRMGGRGTLDSVPFCA